eukprot:6543721-Prymnesium_polylepis.1
MMNAERASRTPPEPPVSRQQICDAEERVEIIRRRRRSTKAGSVEEESEWAQASVNQSVQMIDQRRRGELQRERNIEPQAARLKVEKKSVVLDSSDEWGLLGEAFEIKRGMWGGPVWKGTWPCQVVGYKESYWWEDGRGADLLF